MNMVYPTINNQDELQNQNEEYNCTISKEL